VKIWGCGRCPEGGRRVLSSGFLRGAADVDSTFLFCGGARVFDGTPLGGEAGPALLSGITQVLVFMLKCKFSGQFPARASRLRQ
jgi:hypothetical protein